MVYLDPPFNTGKRFDMKMRVGAKGYRTARPPSPCPRMKTAGVTARSIWA